MAAEKQATTTSDEEKLVKVKMTEPMFDLTWGKMRGDGVYEFPMEQAARYVKAGIARPAPASAKTAREEDRAILMKDQRARAKTDELEAEMAAAWDVDVRDVERAQFEAEAAAEDAEAKKAAAARAEARAASGKMPGPVNTTVEEEAPPEAAPEPEPAPQPAPAPEPETPPEPEPEPEDEPETTRRERGRR
jgi:hypothetical protein